MNMRTLWEDTSSKHTRFGFYVVDNQVLFEYSGPFDTDTWEWISAKTYFRRLDFERGIEALDQGREYEMTGIGGEKLRLGLLPTGTVSLALHTGHTDGLTIADLGVRPACLRLSQTAG